MATPDLVFDSVISAPDIAPLVKVLEEAAKRGEKVLSNIGENLKIDPKGFDTLKIAMEGVGAGFRDSQKVAKSFEQSARDTLATLVLDGKKGTAEWNKQLDVLKAARAEAEKYDAALGEVESSIDEATKASTGLSSTLVNAAAAGALLQGAGDFLSSFSESGLELRDSLRRVQAQTGATAEEMKVLQSSAETAFKGGVGENLAEATKALGTAKQLLGNFLEDDELGSFVQQAGGIAKVFDKDVNEVIAKGRTFIAQFGLDGQEAGDLLSFAMQKGGSAMDDVLDTTDEYSQLAVQAGYSAQEFVGVLTTGIQAGARDTDKLADALKEAQIRLKAGDTAKTLSEIGAPVARAIEGIVAAGEAGQISVKEVLQRTTQLTEDAFNSGQISEAIRTQLQVAVAGTPAEDIGSDIYARVFGAEIDTAQITEQAKKAGEEMAKAIEPQSFFERVEKSFSVLQAKASAAFAPVIAGAGDVLHTVGQVGPGISFLTSKVQEAGGLSQVFSNLGASAKSFGSTVASVGKKGLSFLFSWKGAALGAIGALVAIALTNDDVKESFQDIAKVLSDAVAPIIQSIAPLIVGIVDSIKPVLTAIADVLGGIVSSITGAIGGVIGKLTEAFAGIFQVVGPLLEKVLSIVTPIIDIVGEQLFAAFNNVSEAVTGILDAILPVFDALIASFAPILEELSTTLTPIFEQLGEVIGTVFSAIGGNIASLVQSFVPIITGLATTLLPIVSTIADAIGQVYSTIVSAFSSILQTVIPIVATLVETVGTLIAQIIDYLAPVLQTILSTLTGVLGTVLATLATVIGTVIESLLPAIDGILQAVLPLVSILGEALGGILSTLLPIVADLVNSLLGVLVPVISSIGEIVAKLATTLGGVLATAISALSPVIAQLATTLGMILGVVGDVAATLIASLLPVFDALVGVIQTFLPIVVNLVSTLLDGLTPVISIVVSTMGQLLTIIGGLVSQIVTALAPVLTMVAELLGSLLGVVGSVISQIAEALAPVFEQLAGTLGDVLAVLGDVIGELLSALMPAIEMVVGLIAEAVKWLGDGLGDTLEMLMPIIAGLARVLGTVLAKTIKVVATILQKILKIVSDVAKAIGKWLVGAIKDAVAWIKGAFKSAIDAVSNALSWLWGMINTVISAISTLINWVVNAGKAVIDFARDIPVVGDVINWISGAIESLIGWIKDAIGWLLELFGVFDDDDRALKKVGEIKDALNNSNNLDPVTERERIPEPRTTPQTTPTTPVNDGETTEDLDPFDEAIAAAEAAALQIQNIMKKVLNQQSLSEAEDAILATLAATNENYKHVYENRLLTEESFERLSLLGEKELADKKLDIADEFIAQENKKAIEARDGFDGDLQDRITSYREFLQQLQDEQEKRDRESIAKNFEFLDRLVAFEEETAKILSEAEGARSSIFGGLSVDLDAIADELIVSVEALQGKAGEQIAELYRARASERKERERELAEELAKINEDEAILGEEIADERRAALRRKFNLETLKEDKEFAEQSSVILSDSLDEQIAGYERYGNVISNVFDAVAGERAEDREEERKAHEERVKEIDKERVSLRKLLADSQLTSQEFVDGVARLNDELIDTGDVAIGFWERFKEAGKSAISSIAEGIKGLAEETNTQIGGSMTNALKASIASIGGVSGAMDKANEAVAEGAEKTTTALLEIGAGAIASFAEIGLSSENFWEDTKVLLQDAASAAIDAFIPLIASALAFLGPFAVPAAIIAGQALKAVVASFETGGVIEGGRQLIQVNEAGTEAVLNAPTTSALGKDVIDRLNASDFSIDPLGNIVFDAPAIPQFNIPEATFRELETQLDAIASGHYEVDPQGNLVFGEMPTIQTPPTPEAVVGKVDIVAPDNNGVERRLDKTNERLERIIVNEAMMKEIQLGQTRKLEQQTEEIKKLKAKKHYGGI